MTYDPHYRERELSNELYEVVNIDYLADGRLSVCLKKDGEFIDYCDYLKNYRSYKEAESAIIKKALNNT